MTTVVAHSPAPPAYPDGVVRVLIVEDNARDAELVQMTLRRGGVNAECVVAADEEQLRSVLATFVPDVVLCDFSLPNFDGLAAQRIVGEVHSSKPVIFVSGTISEELAVLALQSGAVDYVLKSSLQRLPSSVLRAVRETRSRFRLETSLRDSEERSRRHALRLEALWAIVNDPELTEAERWLAMLRQAAGSIWAGRQARGTLWRVDGDQLVLEAVAESSSAQLVPIATPVGGSIPFATSIIGTMARENLGTHSWNDVLDGTCASDHAKAHGTRAFAATMFSAGGATWALAFANGRPAAAPLGSQEHAYLEVLASFFANHVQQRWQYQRIEYQQSHDVLTGLLNRSQFRSRARIASRTSAMFAVILLDIDAFHEINDSYGNMIGDALLVEIGTALLMVAEDDEIVGRVSGDSFAVFLPHQESKEAVEARVLAFAAVFDRPFSTGDRDGTQFIARTANIGVATAPDNGRLFDDVYALADVALVNAQRTGNGSTLYFLPAMSGHAQRRVDLRNELKEAITYDQFTLYYQPHINLATGNVTGCEALIRWNHPVRGLVSPDYFIPFAEQTGIITEIDAWVMRNALFAASAFSEMVPDFRLFFNLSGRQAGDLKIVRVFTDAARAGVKLRNIGVEITETDAMRDVEATRAVCRALRRLNVRIAIDDFGTGYSSLSSLKRLPVDIVKIDRSFISGVTTDAHEGTIAETIISIAERFGFESLGEGAEEPEEVEWLRRQGCTYVQGYAISRPLPLETFKEWLAVRSV